MKEGKPGEVTERQSLGETEGETETERHSCWSSYRMGEKKGNLRKFCLALLTGLSQMNVIH